MWIFIKSYFLFWSFCLWKKLTKSWNAYIHQLQKEFDYKKCTNQYNGQGQEFVARDFNRVFNANNNQWGNNNNNNNNNNNYNNWNNNNNNNNNNIHLNKSKTTIGSKQYSYEAYITSKNLNKPQPNKNNNSFSKKKYFSA